jgi:hypothetical protein
LAHIGKPVGVLVPDEPAAVRVGNPFLAAPGKVTAILLDEQPSACQHLALFCRANRAERCPVSRGKAAVL